MGDMSLVGITGFEPPTLPCEGCSQLFIGLCRAFWVKKTHGPIVIGEFRPLLGIVIMEFLAAASVAEPN